MRKQMEKQALAWDEGEYSNRGLCILVFRNVFGAEEVAADPSEAAKSVERFIVDEAAKFGTLEKVTMFSAHRDGVVLVKFQSGYAAETCRQNVHGKLRGNRRVQDTYRDGVESFESLESTSRDKRIQDFGEWLMNAEVPDED